MWKDSYGFWFKGVRIRKFSSLPPNSGLSEKNFICATIFRELDGSRTLELRTTGNTVRVSCPFNLALDFLLRARVEARTIRAERAAQKAAIEAELAAIKEREAYWTEKARQEDEEREKEWEALSFEEKEEREKEWRRVRRALSQDPPRWERDSF